MSAFLGPIHYWLYDKIEVEEEILNDIINLAKGKDEKVSGYVKQSEKQYGEPKIGKLEDLIDHSNIHGWLQNCIISVDTRLAFVITKLLDTNIVTIKELEEVFSKNGEKYGSLCKNDNMAVENIFTEIYNKLLAGMPCDRVNEVIQNNKDEFIWKTTKDVHKEHWDKVGGNVIIYKKLEKAWIRTFVETIDNNLKYEVKEDINYIVLK